MPLFTICARDQADGFALRASTRAAHLNWLAGEGERVRLGGPWMDAKGQPIGSLLIVEAQDIASARAWAAQDPYFGAGLFAQVDVEPWRLVVGGFG